MLPTATRSGNKYDYIYVDLDPDVKRPEGLY
jgi:hypothetical protein